MNVTNISSYQNLSVVRPEYFFIAGLSGVSNSRYYYIFLFFTYIMAVIGNSVVLLVIIIERNLHNPKYIGVFHLALADLGETNALIPNIMRTFVFETQFISYSGCLLNMFFVFFFYTMQSSSLLVLAFDRLVAICLPLRYHAILNNTVMMTVFSAFWAFNTFLISLTVSCITQLSFCKSNVIESFFCDHGPVYRMSCNSNSVNSFLAKVCTALYLVVPLFLIILSYLGILLSLSKMTGRAGRLKALKTCASHFLLVGTFFLPVIVIYLTAASSSLSPNARIISTSVAYALPPMLNPVIYVLNTAEIKCILRKMVKNRSAPVENFS